MNAIVNTASTQCLGHTAYIGNCKTRDELRKSSHQKLNEYNSRDEIKGSSTNANEKTNKKGLLRKKVTTYDLFITYFHKDNCDACNNYRLVDHEITHETKGERAASISAVAEGILLPEATSIQRDAASTLASAPSQEPAFSAPASLAKSLSLVEEKREPLASLLASAPSQEPAFSAPASLAKSLSLVEEKREPLASLLASAPSQEPAFSAPASLPKSPSLAEEKEVALNSALFSVEDQKVHFTTPTFERTHRVESFVPSATSDDGFDEFLVANSNASVDNY